MKKTITYKEIKDKVLDIINNGGGGGGGKSKLSELNDVTITSANNGQVLTYNGSKWVNANGGGSSKNNLFYLFPTVTAEANMKVVNNAKGGYNSIYESGSAIGCNVVSKIEFDITNISSITIKGHLTSIYTESLPLAVGITTNSGRMSSLNDFTKSATASTAGDYELTVDVSENTGLYYISILMAGVNCEVDEIIINESN